MSYGYSENLRAAEDLSYKYANSMKISNKEHTYSSHIREEERKEDYKSLGTCSGITRDMFELGFAEMLECHTEGLVNKNNSQQKIQITSDEADDYVSINGIIISRVVVDMHMNSSKFNATTESVITKIDEAIQNAITKKEYVIGGELEEKPETRDTDKPYERLKMLIGSLMLNIEDINNCAKKNKIEEFNEKIESLITKGNRGISGMPRDLAPKKTSNKNSISFHEDVKIRYIIKWEEFVKLNFGENWDKVNDKETEIELDEKWKANYLPYEEPKTIS